jgi:hypothetical protein
MLKRRLLTLVLYAHIAEQKKNPLSEVVVQILSVDFRLQGALYVSYLAMVYISGVKVAVMEVIKITSLSGFNKDRIMFAQ